MVYVPVCPACGSCLCVSDQCGGADGVCRYCGHDPDPRPAVAALLDTEMWARLGHADTLTILNTEVPQGSPWSASWESATSRKPGAPAIVLKKIVAGGVQAWLRRHPEVCEAEGIEI